MGRGPRRGGGHHPRTSSLSAIDLSTLPPLNLKSGYALARCLSSKGIPLSYFALYVIHSKYLSKKHSRMFGTKRFNIYSARALRRIRIRAILRKRTRTDCSGRSAVLEREHMTT